MAEIKRSIACILMVATSACGAPAPEGGAGGATTVVRDSAGVRIVEYGEVTHLSAPFQLSPDPIYRIGAGPGEPGFASIVDGVLLADGRAVVASGLTREVVLLDPAGGVETAWGKRGEGPGEFDLIFAVVAGQGDTIVIQDVGLRRLSFFSGGDLVQTLSLPFGPAVRALAIDGDGAVLMGSDPPFAPLDFLELWSQVPLARVDRATGKADTVALADLFPRGRLSPTGRPTGGVFGPMGWSRASAGGFVMGRSDRPELRWLDPGGRLRQVVRWAAAPTPVTDSVWAAREEWYRSVNEGAGYYSVAELNDHLEEQREHAYSTLPYFGRLRVDSDGTVWVEEYGVGLDPIRRIFAIAADGEWIGAVDVHRSLRILDINRGLILGIEQRPLGVEEVVLYRWIGAAPQ